VLGASGNFDPSYLADSELADVAKKVQVPLTDYSDWWLYHPREKGPNGEPGLCFFSHEGGDVDAPVEIPAGSLFLRRLAEVLGLDLPKPAREPAKGGGAKAGALEPVPTGGPLARDFVDAGREPWPLHAVLHEPDAQRLWILHGPDGAGFGVGSRLSLYDVRTPTHPALVSSLDLPDAVSSTFAPVQLAREGSHLLLLDQSGHHAVDVSRPTALRHAGSFRADWGRTAAATAKGVLVFDHYLHSEGSRPALAESKVIPKGDGLAWQPLGGSARDIRPFHRMDLGYFMDVARQDDTLFFAGQDGLLACEVRADGPVVLAKLAGDFNEVRIDVVPELDRVLVLEQFEEEKHAVHLVDTAKKKLRRDAKLFPKHRAMAWSLRGSELWIALCDLREATSLARVRLGPGSPEVLGQWAFSFGDDLPELPELLWLHVQEGTATLLAKDGTLHAFRIPR
jgi:hypothetical protein